MARVKLLMRTSMGEANQIVSCTETRARWLIAHAMAERAEEEEGAEAAESEEREVDDSSEDDDSNDSDEDEGEVVSSEEVTLFDEPAEESNEKLPRPGLSAPVGQWADYALSLGATREEIRGLTKRKLIENYGSN